MIRFWEIVYLCFIFISDLSVLLRLFWLEMIKGHGGGYAQKVAGWSSGPQVRNSEPAVHRSGD